MIAMHQHCKRQRKINEYVIGRQNDCDETHNNLLLNLEKHILCYFIVKNLVIVINKYKFLVELRIGQNVFYFLLVIIWIYYRDRNSIYIAIQIDRTPSRLHAQILLMTVSITPFSISIEDILFRRLVDQTLLVPGSKVAKIGLFTQHMIQAPWHDTSYLSPTSLEHGSHTGKHH